MEVDVRFASGEAEGLRVGDEVDLVASGSQFNAEFGGNYTTAAIGGITGDADLHRIPGLLRLSSCFPLDGPLPYKTLSCSVKALLSEGADALKSP